MNQELISLLSSLISDAKPSSTRTSVKNESILDLITPASVRYSAPENVRLGGTRQPGIPIDMVELNKAISQLMSSEGDEFAKAIGGDILKYREGFNKKREGQSILDEMLKKVSIMNNPGGLVALRTEMGFPSSKSVSALGMFKRGSSEEAPDTLAIFGDKSGDTKYPKQAKDRMVNALLHELIHSGDKTKKGEELKPSSMSSYLNRPEHQEDFEKATRKIAQDSSIKDILFNAIMGTSYGDKFLQSITGRN